MAGLGSREKAEEPDFPVDIGTHKNVEGRHYKSWEKNISVATGVAGVRAEGDGG